jgi:hypothetical protein
MPLARPPASGDQKDELDVGRVDLLVAREVAERKFLNKIMASPKRFERLFPP